MLSFSRLIQSHWRDRRGVAAIEFAFVAPILFILYFMTMEVSQAIETNKKIGRISSMVGDLVAQQNPISPGEIDGILDIGAAIIQPYGRSRPTILIEHIQVEDKANPTKAFIKWSRQLDGSTKKPGISQNTEVMVPEELMERGRYLVRVTTKLNYRPVIAWTTEQKTALGLASAFDNISMSELSYLRPRNGGEIRCERC
ncbi:TadE/TadG family type IV pilus assembly protein [Aliihoeflea sp. PC F10.4]